MTGSIEVREGASPEQVLIGEYNGLRVIVLSVQPTEESARSAWEAACKLVDTGMFEGSPALIIDILKATVRHGYVTEMQVV